MTRTKNTDYSNIGFLQEKIQTLLDKYCKNEQEKATMVTNILANEGLLPFYPKDESEINVVLYETQIAFLLQDNMDLFPQVVKAMTLASLLDGKVKGNLLNGQIVYKDFPFKKIVDFFDWSDYRIYSLEQKVIVNSIKVFNKSQFWKALLKNGLKFFFFYKPVYKEFSNRFMERLLEFKKNKKREE